MMTALKLTDIFPDWLTTGAIFTALEKNVSVPWEEIIDGWSIDIEYIGNRSGSKLVAPLVYKLLDENAVLSDDNLNKLVQAIWARYGRNWSALYETTIADYNPLENYNMTETEQVTESGSITHGKKTTHNLTDSRTENATRESSGTSSLNTTNEIDGAYYGFNTSDAKPANKDNSTTNTQGSTAENITDTNIESVKHTGDTTDSGTDNTTADRDRSMTRSGNIGVTTSQQLLQSERDLWFWNFVEQLFDDVDKMLTLSVFDHSECIQLATSAGSTYVLPIANATTLGGVMPATKTTDMTQSVGVDSTGRLWTTAGETAEPYVLPVASQNTLGGVMPTTKTTDMTQSVGVDSTGRLWTTAGETAEPYVLPVASKTTLGGVMPDTKTTDMTQSVGVDSTGRLWTTAGETAEPYVLPIASANTLGGVQPMDKTATQTAPVGVGTDGTLWSIPPNPAYNLPIATADTLGGVMPYTKTTDMTQLVGVDEGGMLWTKPSAESESYTLPKATFSTLGGVKAATHNEEYPAYFNTIDSSGYIYNDLPCVDTYLYYNGLDWVFISPTLLHPNAAVDYTNLFMTTIDSASGNATITPQTRYPFFVEIETSYAQCNLSIVIDDNNNANIPFTDLEKAIFFGNEIQYININNLGYGGGSLSSQISDSYIKLKFYY